MNKKTIYLSTALWCFLGGTGVLVFGDSNLDIVAGSFIIFAPLVFLILASIDVTTNANHKKDAGSDMFLESVFAKALSGVFLLVGFVKLAGAILYPAYFSFTLRSYYFAFMANRNLGWALGILFFLGLTGWAVMQKRTTTLSRFN